MPRFDAVCRECQRLAAIGTVQITTGHDSLQAKWICGSKAIVPGVGLDTFTNGGRNVQTFTVGVNYLFGMN
jgi:hypothetical protein